MRTHSFVFPNHGTKEKVPYGRFSHVYVHTKYVECRKNGNTNTTKRKWLHPVAEPGKKRGTTNQSSGTTLRHRAREHTNEPSSARDERRRRRRRRLACMFCSETSASTCSRARASVPAIDESCSVRVGAWPPWPASVRERNRSVTGVDSGIPAASSTSSETRRDDRHGAARETERRKGRSSGRRATTSNRRRGAVVCRRDETTAGAARAPHDARLGADVDVEVHERAVADAAREHDAHVELRLVAPRRPGGSTTREIVREEAEHTLTQAHAKRRRRGAEW